MIFSEKDLNLIKKNYEDKLKKLEKENELKEKENKLLKQQNRQKDEIIKDLDKYNYRGQCESLKLENQELKKKLNKYEELLGIAKIKLEKNSSNSLKPSSTNGYKKVIQNNRVKSGRKPGREKGHKRSAPTVTKNPDKIVKVSKVATCTCGCKTVEQERISRDLISIKVITHTTQYVGMKTKCPCCNKEYLPNFPTNVNSIVNYDEEMKALIVYLNTYCNLPNQKVIELLGFLSDGKIGMCTGTVGNTVKSFSKKSEGARKSLKDQILKEPVINEDETPTSVDGKIMSTIGVFTKRISYLDTFANRKLESFEEMGILNKYIGTVCHDHNNIHRSFIQSKQAECNFHILRYCKGEYEVHKREVIWEFMNHLLELRDKVDIYKLQGKDKFEKEEYEKAKEKYLSILNRWHQEHIKTSKNKPKYYGSERCLINRLKEFADDHLRFLTDFRIDFTNNLAERGLRKIKMKLKVSGGFRNLNYAKYYCHAITIIDTCKKQKLNIKETLIDIFKGKKKVFVF